MSSPGTSCTALGELRAIVFRRRPICRSVVGRSNGSRFRGSARPARCIGRCRGCARSLSCTLSRRAPIPRVVLCRQTFVRSRHAPLLGGAFFGGPFCERSKRPQCGIAGEHQRGLVCARKSPAEAGLSEVMSAMAGATPPFPIMPGASMCSLAVSLACWRFGFAARTYLGDRRSGMVRLAPVLGARINHVYQEPSKGGDP